MQLAAALQADHSANLAAILITDPDGSMLLPLTSEQCQTLQALVAGVVVEPAHSAAKVQRLMHILVSQMGLLDRRVADKVASTTVCAF